MLRGSANLEHLDASVFDFASILPWTLSTPILGSDTKTCTNKSNLEEQMSFAMFVNGLGHLVRH